MFPSTDFGSAAGMNNVKEPLSFVNHGDPCQALSIDIRVTHKPMSPHRVINYINATSLISPTLQSSISLEFHVAGKHHPLLAQVSTEYV